MVKKYAGKKNAAGVQICQMNSLTHTPLRPVLILDFGSQYTQLIARRVRELGVYCEVHPFDITQNDFESLNPLACILSGGPASVFDQEAPQLSSWLLDTPIPKLGICYGLQSTVKALDGKVARANHREYGRALLTISDNKELFSRISETTPTTVWMSHSDQVVTLPDGFEVLASTRTCPYAAVRSPKHNFYGVQFHPEVVHTERGSDILKGFLFEAAKLEKNWQASAFAQDTIAAIKVQVGEHHAICGLSGGVDSSVAAVLVSKAIGQNLTCIFVDNGLLRKNEARDVMALFSEHMALNVVHVDASQRFVDALSGVTDPETKRKIIGKLFIEVFDEEAKRLERDGNEAPTYLVQGTLYPDVIESVSHRGPSAVIKSHHNVGGLPAHMKLELIEPLRMLFKDEVRRVGVSLGIPERVLYRQPFPGPGLAVRCPGEITAEKLEILRNADAIFTEEIEREKHNDTVWQYFAALLPVRSVGVMGDERTYDYCIALRAVESQDGMTADWAKLPHDFLARVSSRIINEVKGCNRVVYDISSKPPATIEWE